MAGAVVVIRKGADRRVVVTVYKEGGSAWERGGLVGMPGSFQQSVSLFVVLSIF